VFPRGARNGLLVTDFVEIFVVIVGEIGHIEECVSFQTEIHKCGLHAGQDARDAALVDAAGEGVLVGPLKKYFYKDVVLKNGHLCFVAVGGNY
jgi:hypothetical protein